jgi:hypothetical protein
MSDETAAPSPIPPNPFKLLLPQLLLPDSAAVLVYSSPELELHEVRCCDAAGRQLAATVEIPRIAGIIVHPDVAAAMWRAAGGTGG